MPISECVDNSKAALIVAKVIPAIEALFELAARLLGLMIVYIIFNKIGAYLTDDDFKPDILLSLVVLPAIYILKDLNFVLQPFFVKVWLADNDVTVDSGVLTKRLDCLNLANVENIELVTTFGGRFFNYATLHVYAFGSCVSLPHVINPLVIKSQIENAINER